jgi:hypothetical protein
VNKIKQLFYSEKLNYFQRLRNRISLKYIDLQHIQTSNPPAGVRVFADNNDFPTIMRQKEGTSWVASEWFPKLGRLYYDQQKATKPFERAAWENGPIANYLARCNLRGSYIEFGVFWGRSFFKNIENLNQILSEKFIAVDSFQGLGRVTDLESYYTGGDFQTGAYACGLKNFMSLAGHLNIPMERIEVIEADLEKYEESKRELEPILSGKKISFCHIDVDTFNPTYHALKIVQPYLEQGAVVRFDDWRLSRCDQNEGEYGGAKKWLIENEGVALEALCQDGWQDQAFIYRTR